MNFSLHLVFYRSLVSAYRSQLPRKNQQNPSKILPDALKITPKIYQKWSQNGPKSSSGTLWGPPCRKHLSETPPGHAQDSPKSPQVAQKTPQTLPKSPQNPSKIIKKNISNFKTFFKWIFEPTSSQNPSFFVSFCTLLELKITEIMKTSIFENLHSRCSESIEFLIFFMKISWNFASKSLPKRVESLDRVFHRFYLQNDPKMTPKMVQNRPKIDKKTYLKSYRISLKIFISFLSIFGRSWSLLGAWGVWDPG